MYNNVCQSWQHPLFIYRHCGDNYVFIKFCLIIIWLFVVIKPCLFVDINFCLFIIIRFICHHKPQFILRHRPRLICRYPIYFCHKPMFICSHPILQNYHVQLNWPPTIRTWYVSITTTIIHWTLYVIARGISLAYYTHSVLYIVLLRHRRSVRRIEFFQISLLRFCRAVRHRIAAPWLWRISYPLIHGATPRAVALEFPGMGFRIEKQGSLTHRPETIHEWAWLTPLLLRMREYCSASAKPRISIQSIHLTIPCVWPILHVHPNTFPFFLLKKQCVTCCRPIYICQLMFLSHCF